MRRAVFMGGLLGLAAWPLRAAEKAALPGAAVTAAAQVGRYAHASKMVFEGNASFTPAVLRQGLLNNSEFLLAAYPTESLDAFLRLLEDCLKRGYEEAGFPEARVTARLDAAAEVVRVTIVEGRRFRRGTLRVEGLQSVDGAAFSRELVEKVDEADGFGRRITDAENNVLFDMPMPNFTALPNPAADSDPLSAKNLAGGRPIVSRAGNWKAWKPGEHASFGKAADEALKQQITEQLRWRGVSAQRLEVTHRRDEGSGVADTVVKVEEGPRVVLRAISITGLKKLQREAVLKFLGLEEGRPVTDDLVTRVEDLLARSLRFVRWRCVLVQVPEGLELCLGVQEMPGAPPLEQALDADEKEFVRLAEWITQMDQEEVMLEARVVLADGSVDAESDSSFTWASGRGMQLQVQGSLLGGAAESITLALIRGGLSVLLEEGGQQNLWRALAPAARLEGSVNLTTELDEQGRAAGSFRYLAGYRSAKPGQNGVNLRVVFAPTEFYRISKHPKGEVRRIEVEGVKCLEIVYHELRFLWDLQHQRLRECRFPIDEADKGPARRFVQIREGGEQWKRLEAVFARREADAVVKANRFIDWARLLLKIPDLEAKSEGVLTPETVQRHALLLDLSSHLLKSLLQVWEASAANPNSFHVPARPSPDGTSPQLAATGILANLWFLLGDAVLPADSWLWELGREAFYAEMGRKQGTQEAMLRLSKDPRIGPYGARLAETILNRLKLPQAVIFRRLAAQKLSAEDFRKDWELLFDAPVGWRESMDHLFTELKGFDERELQLVGGTGGLGLEKPLVEAVARLRQSPGARSAELLWPVAESWWKSHGQASFQKRLGPISRLLPPDPALVAARVNETDITRAEVLVAAREREQLIRNSLADQKGEMDRQIARLHEEVLEELIQKTLMIEAFEKNGGTIQQQYVDADVDNLINLQFKGDRAAFHRALAVQNVTAAQFEQMRRELMITNFVRGQIMSAAKDPGEGQLRAAYDEHFVRNRARQVHLHAITLPKTAQDAAKLAAELQARAKQGEDFEKLAKAHSADESASNGGCRGTLNPSELQKPLQDAVRSMKAGDVSPVIEIETVYVILWIKEEKPAPVPAFEKERPRLLEEVRGKMREALLKQWTDETRQAAYIEVFPAP